MLDKVELPKRLFRVQQEILARYDCIINLWVAYHNSGKFPDDFGREFYYAVGKLLQGTPIPELHLQHLDPAEIHSVVDNSKQLECALVKAKKTATGRKETRCQRRKKTRKAKLRQNRAK